MLLNMRWWYAVLLVVILAALVALNYFRPITAIAASPSLPAETTTAGLTPTVQWPTTGLAAIGVSGLGFIASSGNAKPLPAASVTKVMTALLILEDKPLKLNEPGPSITITDTDVQTYQADLVDMQSVVEVRAGEQLTEYQALEAVLIPSGNNIADTLARWDAGSTAAFVGKMNVRAKALHLANTTFADASGVSANNVSTPRDLMALGMTAMKQEVLAQVVSLPQATLPVAGLKYNVDYALGQSGIIGIKTGSGLDLGANFLFAATATVDNHPITLFGCVMGQPTLDLAFSAAKALIASMLPILHVRRVVSLNQSVGAYVAPWGSQTGLLSTVDVDLVEWPGMVLRQRLDAPSIVIDKSLPAGTAEGSEHIVLGDYLLDVPLVTAGALYPPGRAWRLTRLV
jgi:serine-type D-Ala-D-Ala carboxypeptidase (penicillin-binding protein 5/6)